MFHLKRIAPAAVAVLGAGALTFGMAGPASATVQGQMEVVVTAQAAVAGQRTPLQVYLRNLGPETLNVPFLDLTTTSGSSNIPDLTCHFTGSKSGPADLAINGVSGSLRTIYPGEEITCTGSAPALTPGQQQTVSAWFVADIGGGNDYDVRDAVTISIPDRPVVPMSLWSNTDPATLTIHKVESPASGIAADGTAASDVSNPPVAGVAFTVAPITGYDLATDYGWAQLAADQNAGKTVAQFAAQAGQSVGLPLTDANGLTTLSTDPANGLPNGLYLVTEDPANSTNPNVVASEPFLVMLPLNNDGAGTEWNYDVHVYPKNHVVDITKTVSDAPAAVAGDPVDWTIVSDIGTDDYSPLTDYVISDQLDSRLALAADNPVTVELLDATGGVISAVNPADYTLSIAGNLVTVDFNDVSALIAADTGANWKAQVQTTIHTAVTQPGEISNEAAFTNTNGTNQVTITTDPVATKWGSVQITKVDSVNGATLPGAQFQVFLDDGTGNPIGQPLAAIDGRSGQTATTFTTKDDGLAPIQGLRYSDFANGHPAAVGEAGYQSYVLVEVKAPDGYQAGPNQTFTITNEGATMKDGALMAFDVPNTPVNSGIQLPFTGGTGTTTITIAGGIILTLAAAGTITRTRKAKAEPRH